METVRSFAQISKADVALAGGKGASLGEMTHAGFPVPSGFVVLSTVFDAYKGAALPIEIKKEILDALDTLGASAVAVRSSATVEDGTSASWAGELETYLNVSRSDLLDRVQECWASVSSPRAVAYREEQGLSESQISVAVVVQQMVPSEVAGVAFTVHPVTKDRQQIAIEAAPGLGEAVVSGSVTPDLYVVAKDSLLILDRYISEDTQALSDAHILDLATLCKMVENHYGFPCDIEWAYANASLFLLQSRPITTL